MTSSEPSTSRLPEEESSDMDSDSDNEVPKLTLTIKSLHLSGLLSLKKSDCLPILYSMQRLPMGHNFKKGIFFCLLYEVLS